MTMKPAHSETPIELRNGRTRIAVDPQTGSVLRIEDASTGVVHLDALRGGRADGRLFRIVIPGESWWSCYADSQEQTNVRCTESCNGIVLDYPDLKTADGCQTGVAVRVEIQCSDKPDEIRFRLHVENRGARTVLDTTHPLLGGWHEDGEESRIALGANRFITPALLRHAAGNNYARNGKRLGFHYPVDLACPWIDISRPGGGLAYVNGMTEGRNGKFWIENLAGYGDDFRLMFGWSHFLALKPGESWSSPEMTLAVHDGDWRRTARRYSDWFDTQHPPDISRPAVRSRIGFQNLFLRGFDGTPINPFDAIPAAAESGRRYGVDLLCVWDTLTLGNYARHDPRDLTDYSPEQRNALRRGLQQAEAQGTRTCALTNFRHPNVGLHLPDPDLQNRVQKRFTGTFRTENWTGNHTFGDLWAKHIGPESYVFSPFSAAHRERVFRLTRDYLDLGYSSMFYDQPFEQHPDYGFADQEHAPDATHHEALQIVREVRRMLLAKDPQAIVIGEESDIHATPTIDQWMSWSISAPSPQLIERVAMMRYAMPHTILSWVVDHEPERTAIAFALGMQLCLMVHGAERTLAAEPAFAERVKALADLRRKTAERTVMARFRNHDGIELEGEDGFAAFAYESASGPAVIATACGTAAKGKITVCPDAFTSECAGGGGVVYSLDGAQAAHAGTTCEFDLSANDVAVWTL
jgi:hypothetical protein